jgi:8-oxo-dGTP diphosphatase
MAHTRVGAYGVCVAGGRILLSRYTSGNWTLPGGGVDFGEDPYDGVIREETGYVVEPEALLGVRSVVWKAERRTGPTHTWCRCCTPCAS